MGKVLVVLIFLVLTSNAFSLTIDQRRQGIIKIIDQELSEVRRLSSQTGNKNPDHLLRIAELYLEKARLIRERENDEFMKLSEKEAQRTNKNNFFKLSNSYFRAANNACLQITRSFKNYRNIGDVYYILAYNAKEASNDKLALKYFNLATNKSKKNTKTEIKSKISLAEIYYNQKNYRKAIPLYEGALRVHQDRWYTKDAMNLAWCYFRVRRYDNAISKMLEVYSKSKDKNFEDMSSYVERDIGLFYATSGRIDDGVSFYKKLGRNFTNELLSAAMRLKDEGQLTNAKKVLESALRYEKDDKRKSSIYIEMMNLYDKYGQVSLLLNAANAELALVKNNSASSEDTKRLVYFSDKYAALLQKQAISKTYKNVLKTRRLKANQSVSFFEISKEIKTNEADEILFYQGETYYGANFMSDALSKYKASFDLAKNRKNKKIMNRALEGMLAVLASNKTPAKTKNENYIPVYEAYLSENQRGPNSYKIYSRLFNVYEGKGQVAEAESVLLRFSKNYPKDFKVQEAMLAKLMEKQRKSKNYGKLKSYIDDINSKKYVVSTKFANKLRELLTTIQIESVQNSLDKGDKKFALTGYHDILKSPDSTESAKTNSIYNLAILYYELGAKKESYNWSVEALKRMSAKDVNQFSDSFLAISSFLFGRLETEASADISLRLLAKLCPLNTTKKNVAFKNSVYLYLAEKNIEKTQETLALASRCKVNLSEIVQAEEELLWDYKEQKRYEDFEKLIYSLMKYPSAYSTVIIALDELQEIHTKFGNEVKARSALSEKMRIFNLSNKQKINLNLAALNIIAKEKLKSFYQLEKRMKGITLSFPENTFNAALKLKLELITKLTTEFSALQNLGSGLGIVESYRVIVDAYQSLALEIDRFTPEGKDEAYVTSFRKNMNQVSAPLKTQALSYLRKGESVIHKNEILQEENIKFFSLASNKFFPRYWYPKAAVIMDRGGVR